MWTIGQVARLSGVTSRTLRHYDAIGLLTPSGTGPGGRRLYGHEELLRLQQILVLRELGVDLAGIAVALDDGVRPDHLRSHHERLVAERDRLARLAETVARTIETLEKGVEMAAKDLYRGFDQSQYEQEARERWGNETIDRSNASWAALGEEGRARFRRENQENTLAIAEVMRAGVPADDERTQALIARHYAHTCVFWTPDAASYTGLGQMYVDDPRFTATYDAIASGLAPYLRDAMATFARTRLT